jgi:hypothetical protein
MVAWPDAVACGEIKHRDGEQMAEQLLTSCRERKKRERERGMGELATPRYTRPLSVSSDLPLASQL